ncbi:MAG: hypothetical protein ACJAZN_000462 [Planctomycetota bacterium]|jgi:hypothetical protein
MRAFSPFVLFAPLVLGVVGCSAVSSSGYDPRSGSQGELPRADSAYEIGAIAAELADRAESRTSLGTARIQLGTFDAIEPRHSPYRQVILLERDLRATQATVRHELEMALGNRVNVVGDGADLATHVIEGEFLRSAESLDLSLRLVELKSDWIVATARRRIDGFVPEYYDRRLQTPGGPLPQGVGPSADPAEAASRNGSDGGESERQKGRSRALRPAYPPAPNVALTPLPIEVLSAKIQAAGGAQKSRVAQNQPGTAGTVEEAEPFPSALAAPAEFDRGPAADRLRASGGLPPVSREQ